MNARCLRNALRIYLALLLPVAWLAMRFAPYNIDGDAVAYMDIGGLMLHHRWAGIVNGYWHPLYPAVLALARIVLRPGRVDELGAYYIANFFVFLAGVAAMLAFVTALDRLRSRMAVSAENTLLSGNSLRLLGVALVVIASQRELSFDKVRPDALLQALMLSAFAMLLFALASDSLIYAPAMGLFLGLAYLTKSFALVVAILSIALLLLFSVLVQRRRLPHALVRAGLAALLFAAVAGPYITALSFQKHRLDFGDSGTLNYAWFAGGTEKLHLEPGQPARYGSADVHLIHPDQPLLKYPAVFSYKAEPFGTYPEWFDPTFFNERIVPHLNARVLFHRDLRNAVLIVRYVLNHPEAWILLALLLAFGARLRFGRWRENSFWLPPTLLGLAIFAIYGLVNIEERYVTLAYLAIVIPLFATLQVPAQSTADGRTGTTKLSYAASAMVLLLAFGALGESLRTALENRRVAAGSGMAHSWFSPQIFGAAEGLHKLGVKPGDEIACMGTKACVYDHYWARLAGVRILSEVYNSDSAHLYQEWMALSDRDQVKSTLQAEGAKVLVAYFPAETIGPAAPPASAGWRRLGDTNFYAMPIRLTPAPLPPQSPLPWSMDNLGP